MCIRDSSYTCPALRPYQLGLMRIPECNHKVTVSGYKVVVGCEAETSTRALVTCSNLLSQVWSALSWLLTSRFYKSFGSLVHSPTTLARWLTTVGILICLFSEKKCWNAFQAAKEMSVSCHVIPLCAHSACMFSRSHLQKKSESLRSFLDILWQHYHL